MNHEYSYLDTMSVEGLEETQRWALWMSHLPDCATLVAECRVRIEASQYEKSPHSITCEGCSFLLLSTPHGVRESGRSVAYLASPTAVEHLICCGVIVGSP